MVTGLAYEKNILFKNLPNKQSLLIHEHGPQQDRSQGQHYRGFPPFSEKSPSNKMLKGGNFTIQYALKFFQNSEVPAPPKYFFKIPSPSHPPNSQTSTRSGSCLVCVHHYYIHMTLILISTALDTLYQTNQSAWIESTYISH